MRELEHHERFELEVLEHLAQTGFLRPLVFGGGTMLRLCHELPRYSVDLDFWFRRKVNMPDFYNRLLSELNKTYRITDSKNKHFTLLYEFKGDSPRRLKIEIRKEILKTGFEDRIAYSRHGGKQVLVPALSLAEMARRKIKAACSRGEIRDFFDLEFLLRQNIPVSFTPEDKRILRERAIGFKKVDFGTGLGSLLPHDLREYYKKTGFAYLLTRLA